jgi:hypothetical protein
MGVSRLRTAFESHLLDRLRKPFWNFGSQNRQRLGLASQEAQMLEGVLDLQADTVDAFGAAGYELSLLVNDRPDVSKQGRAF